MFSQAGQSSASVDRRPTGITDASEQILHSEASDDDSLPENSALIDEQLEAPCKDLNGRNKIAHWVYDESSSAACKQAVTCMTRLVGARIHHVLTASNDRQYAALIAILLFMFGGDPYGTRKVFTEIEKRQPREAQPGEENEGPAQETEQASRGGTEGQPREEPKGQHRKAEQGNRNSHHRNRDNQLDWENRKDTRKGKRQAAGSPACIIY
ncbi:hypothetical protein M5K25_013626 [Dendrobium thyrsiflorum]|uniref:Uncharacterized protein n=1 Tax=Dendrobium thyrsiflorum TaxID=117978 RepID=A0ABD0V1D2_DENTH